MLQAETKQEIAARAAEYMQQNEMTAADLSKHCKVNQSYLSAILNGKLSTDVGGKDAVIGDGQWLKLADSIGMTVQKVYWKFIRTREFDKLVDQLMEAKEKTITKTLICSTGMGKTYAVRRFKEKFPKHTYVVTINSLMTLKDIINVLIEEMKLPDAGSLAMKIRSVIMEFRRIRRNGGQPILIIDEGENMNGGTMRMIKGLYDGICDGRYSSIVLMGTDQLMTKMESTRKRDKEAAPQFYRRFKAGIRLVRTESPEKGFVPFFEAMGIKDKSFRSLLLERCENYGELHDVLEPAMREADMQGVEFTEEFFRIMYDLPTAA